MQSRFTHLLMQWHLRHNTRSMPWKGEKDPYKIWLSEVILQQTRVAQGLAYYERFIQAYPTVQQLAAAPDQEVFKRWEGLGYYNRCRNLLFTAREITQQRGGKFPDTYEDILALKGVGPYTAAAIASFAYDLPHAVLDGNVFRVLSRFFGIDEPVDAAGGKILFGRLAEEMLYKKQPGQYNQAIMDFGAVICTPFSPACHTCPLQTGCAAFAEGRVNELPVKEKRLERKRRWFYYFLFEHKDRLLVHERKAKDIWQNLYEFYLLEAEDAVHWNETAVKQWLAQQLGINKVVITGISTVQEQQLTHRQVKGQFIRVRLDAVPASLKKYHWATVKELDALPFPKFITQYLHATGLR